MLAHLIYTMERVRDSLWALPLAVALLCGALALVALNTDAPGLAEIGWLYSGGSEQAAEFASSLVSAMITLAALAFSITMVVLALAAQQLGPRLIEIFMRDRGTQVSLGLFLGTVLYLLLILRAFDGDETESPALAVTGGTALVLASVVTLLFFVHSLARSIVSDSIIARVGAVLDDTISSAFPPETPAENDRPPPDKGMPVQIESRGYVQRIDHATLVRAARKHDATIVLAYSAGAHVIDGEVDAWVASTADLTKSIAKAVVIGPQRSPSQDPEWSERQLVEIALRALSPGINDVFTALAVIDRLSQSLALLMMRGEARQVWSDEDGVARVFGPAPTFDALIHAAFEQIREAGARQGAVLRRLAENLLKLARNSDRRHVGALARQFDLLEASARRLPDGAERFAIDAAIRCGRSCLAACADRPERARVKATERVASRAVSSTYL